MSYFYLFFEKIFSTLSYNSFIEFLIPPVTWLALQYREVGSNKINR